MTIQVGPFFFALMLQCILIGERSEDADGDYPPKQLHYDPGSNGT